MDFKKSFILSKKKNIFIIAMKKMGLYCNFVWVSFSFSYTSIFLAKFFVFVLNVVINSLKT